MVSLRFFYPESPIPGDAPGIHPSLARNTWFTSRSNEGLTRFASANKSLHFIRLERPFKKACTLNVGADLLPNAKIKKRYWNQPLLEMLLEESPCSIYYYFNGPLKSVHDLRLGVYPRLSPKLAKSMGADRAFARAVWQTKISLLLF